MLGVGRRNYILGSFMLRLVKTDYGKWIICKNLKSASQKKKPVLTAFEFCEIPNGEDGALGVLCPVPGEEGNEGGEGSIGTSTLTSTQSGDDCDCVVIGECSEVLDLIRNRFFEILNSNYKMCGFESLTPKFCCPRTDKPIDLFNNFRIGINE